MAKPQKAHQTVILLGASNLSRAFPTALNCLQQGFGSPLVVHAAMGHGRSFGGWSQIVGRALPGIINCDLWARLTSDMPSAAPPVAAITDLGNDLVYGHGAAKLLNWLDICLERLHQLNCQTVLMSLPLASLERLTEARFELIRRLIFPGQAARWPELQQHIGRLDAGMRTLAEHYRTGWVEAPQHWYGMDHIHIRREHQADALCRQFALWSEWRNTTPCRQPDLWTSLRLRCLKPAERTLLGLRQITPQPVIDTPALRLCLY